MQKIISLIQTDFKNIFRDKSLFSVLFVPFILISILRYGIPIATTYLPVLSEYYVPIVAFSCILSATFPAYIMAFVMIDEKDQKLFNVFKVMPFSFSKFVLYRLGIVALFSFLFSIMMLSLNGLIVFSFAKVFILSLIVSLEAPLVQLFVVSFAKNKIEGLTMFKLVNMFLILPVLSWFFETVWIKIMSIIPVYWTFMAVDTENSINFYAFSLISVIMHLLLIFVFYRRLKTRVL